MLKSNIFINVLLVRCTDNDSVVTSFLMTSSISYQHDTHY